MIRVCGCVWCQGMAGIRRDDGRAPPAGTMTPLESPTWGHRPSNDWALYSCLTGRGRGLDMVKPAWMTKGGAGAGDSGGGRFDDDEDDRRGR
jgi:hypothetical protein